MNVDNHAKVMHEEFAFYPEKGERTNTEIAYLTLGLTGEAGEVAEKIKKAIRDGQFDSEQVAKELGDVYWYLGQLCIFLGKKPSEVIQMNYDKLASRKQRDVLGGSGDER